jgi:hypothetical protein
LLARMRRAAWRREMAELAGRELIAERLGDEVEWLHDCARWLAQLDLGKHPPVTNLRPEADHPERCNVVVDIGRVRGVLLRIAADIDELARARSVEELEHAQVEPDARAERRRRLAESPLAFPRAWQKRPPVPPSAV